MKLLKNKVIILPVLFLISGIFYSCDTDKGSGPSDKTAGTARLESLCDSVVNNTPVPGIIAGFWSGENGIAWEYAAGKADVSANVPMNTNMFFRIASITKTMVNSVLFQLVDEGLISMTDTLSRYRPDIPNSDNMTILMLSDMTSGIGEYSSHIDFILQSISNPLFYWHPDTLIKLGTQRPVNAPPGDAWFYSNTNTVILGRIIEELTGNSLEYELRTRIFEPFNLANTSFPVQGNEMPDPHPKAYFPGSQDLGMDWSESYDISVAWAAGAIISTLSDLRIYASLLVDGELTSAESHAFRLNHKVPTNIKDAYYGLGILSWKTFYGHLGGLPGFTSLLLRDPDNDATMIILYNCQLDAYQPADLAERFWEEIYVKDILSPNP